MATTRQPVGPRSAVSSVPIVGVPLEEAELKQIRPDLVFRYLSVKRSLFRRVMDVVTLKSGAPPRQPYRCPRCQPADPDVTISVIIACSHGPAGVVYVECVNGHWARYPCPTS